MKDATDIVIFGGLGDLSVRKLLPALYRAEAGNQLAAHSRIFLISREDISDQSCIDLANAALQKHLNAGEFESTYWRNFSQRLGHISIDLATLDERWEY